jgi:CelD/BcsL family acetyltransferase involved in cellulose biosynthesis
MLRKQSYKHRGGGAGKTKRLRAELLSMPRAEFAVVEDARAFAALEREWDDLYRNSPLATPFQSWAWLYSWWEFYGEGYEPRLVTVRDDEGLLVGLVPLMLERKMGFGRLLWIGTGLSDYLDMLVREGWEKHVAKAAIRALAGMGTRYVADLQQMRPDAAAWYIHRQYDGHQVRVWQDNCPVMEVKPWDVLLTSLSRNLRSTVRRAVRRAAADGLHRKIANAPDTKQAARRLVTLHRENWHERSIGPEHLTTRFEDFIVVAADRLTSRGLGGISEFWHNEEPVISDLFLFGRGYLGTYLLGVSQRARQRYQWSSLFIWDAIEIALSKNIGCIDLLRGQEPYKLRWSSSVIRTHRLILGQERSAWMPYAGYHILRSKAKLYMRSETAPSWIKSAAGEFRALRRKVIREVKKVGGQI